MDLFFGCLYFDSARRQRLRILAFVWICGLLLGLTLGLFAANSMIPLTRQVVSVPVSTGWLLLSAVMPVAVSAFAVYRSDIRLLIPVVFLEACGLAFVGTLVLISFGSAGWLVRLLLTFTGSAVLPVLWVLWLRGFSGDGEISLVPFVPAFSAAFLIGCIDCAMVSPFLTHILSL